MSRLTTTNEATRNAPNVNSVLSCTVDAVQWAVDTARAAGMHALADQLDTHRDGIAGIALDLWGQGKGGAQ